MRDKDKTDRSTNVLAAQPAGFVPNPDLQRSQIRLQRATHEAMTP